MHEAKLTVRSCGQLVSYQDSGRIGMARYGVPASGPMDRLAHRAASAALGRLAATTAVEVSMGGLELVCEEGTVTFCVAGGDFQVTHSGSVSSSWCVRTLREGDVLAIRPGKSGCWAYLAFDGDLATQMWAGSASTHSTSGLGGGMLKRGDSIHVRNARASEEREGPLPLPDVASARGAARVMLGSQTHLFGSDARAAFLSEGFQVTPAFDRMGMRIAGPRLRLGDALAIPSEPIVRGAVQVAGDGVASILLADHQTTGGYPKIANIVSVDLDAIVQLRAGDALRFEAIDADEAVRLVRLREEATRNYLKHIAVPRGTLFDRLMRENLVSGVIQASD